MPQTVEVRFKGTRRDFFLWPDEQEPLRLKEAVVVEAERGHDFGRVHTAGEIAEKKCAGACTRCAVGQGSEGRTGGRGRGGSAEGGRRARRAKPRSMAVDRVARSVTVRPSPAAVRPVRPVRPARPVTSPRAPPRHPGRHPHRQRPAPLGGRRPPPGDGQGAPAPARYEGERRRVAVGPDQAHDLLHRRKAGGLPRAGARPGQRCSAPGSSCARSACGTRRPDSAASAAAAGSTAARPGSPSSPR